MAEARSTGWSKRAEKTANASSSLNDIMSETLAHQLQEEVRERKLAHDAIVFYHINCRKLLRLMMTKTPSNMRLMKTIVRTTCV